MYSAEAEQKQITALISIPKDFREPMSFLQYTKESAVSEIGLCAAKHTIFSSPICFLAPFPWGTITARDCGDQIHNCHIWTEMQKVKDYEISISREKEQRQGLECKDDVRESIPLPRIFLQRYQQRFIKGS